MSNAGLEKKIGTLIDEIRLLRETIADSQNTKVKIDAQAALKDLSMGTSNADWIHLFEWNQRWVAHLSERNQRAARSTYDFVDAEMPGVPFIRNQMDMVRRLQPEISALRGNILDLGVYKGGSTRGLATIFPDHTIHGFDSFEGLPDDWAHVLKGEFGEIKGRLPDMPKNVKLYKGWFSDTLPPWASDHADAPISLLRVDCDIYSSTVDIFNAVGHLLKPGTFILFDEYFGYRGWEHHEYQAFMEYMERTGFSFEYLSYGLTYVMLKLT